VAEDDLQSSMSGENKNQLSLRVTAHRDLDLCADEIKVSEQLLLQQLQLSASSPLRHDRDVAVKTLPPGIKPINHKICFKNKGYISLWGKR
jgi:hypothetical protein